MFTECPECSTAFRVTPQVLKQAGGRVRCGGCGNAFSAIDHLTEEPPVANIDVDKPIGDDPQTEDKFAETSRQLLETLDELAGPDEVRIEDTGIEWRVLDDNEEAREIPPAKASQESLDLDEPEQERQEEQRYDDNTPLPDEFDDDEEYQYTPPVPKRRAGDHDDTDTTEFDEKQADLALSEPEDWTDLLDEVVDEGAVSGNIPLEVEEELAAIHSELSAKEAPAAIAPAEDSVPADIDSQFEMQAEAMGIDISGIHETAKERSDDDEDDAILDDDNDLTDEVPLLDDNDEGFTAEAEIIDEAEGIAVDAATAEDEVSQEEAAEAEDVLEEGVAKAGLESTGEFEANIEIAAKALEGEEDEEEFATKALEGEEDEEEIAAEALEGEEDEEEIAAEAEIDQQEEDVAADAVPTDEEDKNEMTLDEVIELSLEDGEEIMTEADIVEEDMDVADVLDIADAAAADSESEDYEIDITATGSLLDKDEEATGEDEKMDFAAKLVGMDDPSQLFDEDSDQVETIIMEGEFIHDSKETARLHAENEARKRFEDANSLVDTYAANRGMRGGRRSTDPAGYGVIAGTVLLALVLGGQLIHAYRETLSTYGIFNQTIGPVYRMLGNPVTPEWDVKGWQFEATNGSVADDSEVLTIVSRIGNKSQQPLPYPLVHVSLTDRYEEIIGSRVLEPNEYLAGDLDPSKPVVFGENFTAVITIDEPSVDATGFKLNVCYRVNPTRVRCAIEDFKN